MGNTLTKAMMQTVTETANGAKTYASSGSNLIDQFGVAGTYRDREINEVFADQAKIFEENPLMALRFPFYLRLITRKIKIKDGMVTETVQRGQGVRDEAFKRLLWFAVNRKQDFYNNLWLLPIVGSWKDLWTLMYYDEILNLHCLEKESIFQLFLSGMECAEHVDLVKKFMPRIKSNSKLTTQRSKILNNLAKEFAKFANLNCGKYNKLKASGKAHDFQKLITNRMYDNLNWYKIPGKALNILTNSKFLENHNLVENYVEWVSAQPTVKFNGYPFELAKQLSGCYTTPPLYQKITLDKQFEQLIATAKENTNGIKENVLCALDTSGSMTIRVAGDTTAYDICIGLGVFFATLNEGAFHKHVMMFDDKSWFKQLGGSFCDMINQIRKDSTAWGSTNYMSIIDELIRMRMEHPEIDLKEYPTTVLVVSDMQFNSWGDNSETNFEATKERLAMVFPQEWVNSLKFVWWQVNGRYGEGTVPATMNDGGNYLFSGFDGSILSLLLGVEPKINEKGEVVQPSMEEMVQTALTQEILEQVNLG